jgi:hypothetical protein
VGYPGPEITQPPVEVEGYPAPEATTDAEIEAYPLPPTETVPTETPDPYQAPEETDGENWLQSGNFTRILLIIIVIAVWAALAVGGFIFLRRRMQ